MPSQLPKVWLQTEPHPSVFTLLDGKAEVIGPLVRSSASDPLSEIELADAALVGTEFPGTASVLQRAGRLKVLARFGIGVDSIDLKGATELGICVVNTPEAPTVSVAEFTVGVMLAVSRKIKLADQTIRAGGWISRDLEGFDLQGKTVGLIGFGRIGRRLAVILRAFECEVAVFDPYVNADEVGVQCVQKVEALEELLGRSDIVSVHVPLTTETHGLLGASELAVMKRGAILVNVSRGAIVNETDLYHAITSRQLGGAALDVWETEPPASNNLLFSLDNVIATPHAAAMTREGRERSNPSAAQQALMVLDGQCPPFLLNPSVWEKRRR